MNKIVVIGPIYPYRGGIAQYTGLLAKNLNKEYDVEVISFKKQYPKLLYKSNQKDYSNDLFKYDNVKYLIDTTNPASWIKTARVINKITPSIVIVQWWHPYFTFVFHSILNRLNSNIQVVFTCHNVLPHENSLPFRKNLTKYALKRGNSFIVHSNFDKDTLESLLPNRDVIKAVHPSYNIFKQLNIDTNSAKKMLGISENTKILLFFGFIREYKGLKYLIEAMPDICNRIEDIELLIVGDYFEHDKEDYLKIIEESGCNEQIKLFDGYIPDNQVEKFFAAADIVVLPYLSATQSGIVQIAYGFNKPVIATNVGGLPDVVINGKTGYLIEPKNPNDIANAVVKFFEEEDRNKFSHYIDEEKDKYSWDRMNEIISDIIERRK